MVQVYPVIIPILFVDTVQGVDSGIALLDKSLEAEGYFLKVIAIVFAFLDGFIDRSEVPEARQSCIYSG